MSSEWNETTVGDFCPFSYGKALPERDRKYGIFPVISSAGFVGVHNNHLVNKPGVVIGRKGTVGNVTYSENPFWAIDTAFYVADEPEIRDIRFVYFMLKTLGLNQMNSDSAVPGLNRDNAHALPIVIPPIQIQREIADHLQMLDDRITLLLETNTTLEAIAQALFKSWFVDFDPVRAKQEGREPEGMDADTAALFPDSFEESELGLIPKGWNWSTMDSISTVGIGKTPPRKEPQWFSENNKDERWVSIRDMGISGVFISQTSEYLTAESIDRFNVRIIPGNTVLLSFKMTIGRVSLTVGKMTSNEAIAHFKLDEKSPLTSEYIYLYLKQFKYSTLSSTSSIADAVNSKTVKNIPILVADQSILKAFQNNVSAIFYRIKVIEEQSQTLTAIRDTLLPRLISGQLRIPEAEALIEETTA